MKKGLLYAAVALAAIVIVAGFNMQLGSAPEINVPESLAGSTLYVCPAASSTWNSIAISLRPFTRYIVGTFFFVVVLLLFGWGWQLYQNLLTDKFKRESFKNIWGFTKYTFWAGILMWLLLATPNSFRSVERTDIGGEWVLCESTSNGAQPVSADVVHAR